MKIKLLAKLGLITILTLSFTACTRLLQLRKYPTDEVSSAIKINRLPIAYSVTSDIEDLISKNYIDIPFNKAFKSNIDEYMKTKFSEIRNDQSGYYISYQIKQLDIELNYNADFGSAIIGGLLDSKDVVLGQADFTGRSTIKVKLYQNGQLISEKDIVSTSNYNTQVKESNRYYYTYEAYQKVIDMSISKSLVLIDKYFASINM